VGVQTYKGLSFVGGHVKTCAVFLGGHAKTCAVFVLGHVQTGAKFVGRQVVKVVKFVGKGAMKVFAKIASGVRLFSLTNLDALYDQSLATNDTKTQGIDQIVC
jgi:hypothetical protein